MKLNIKIKVVSDMFLSRLLKVLIAASLICHVYPINLAEDSIKLHIIPYDEWPPQQITDLRVSNIQIFNTSATITLSWTAPSEDSKGMEPLPVTKYIIKCATFSIASLQGDTTKWWNMIDGVKIGWVKEFQELKAPGQTNLETITVYSFGFTYYFAIKSIDENNNTSLIDTNAETSNQASAHIEFIRPAIYQLMTPAGGIVRVVDPETKLKISIKIPENAFDFFPGSSAYISINFDPLTKPEKVKKEKIEEANQKIDADKNLYRIRFSEVEFNVYSIYNVWLSTSLFSKECEITLAYLDKNNDGIVDHTFPEVPEHTLRMYVLDEEKGEWVKIPGDQSIDAINNTVTAWVKHFSVYILIGEPRAYTTVAEVEVFPLPCKPGSGESYFDSEFIVFRRLPQNSTIKIYTLTGELVREVRKHEIIDNIYKWNMKNNDNRDVAAGMYFYVITTEKETKTGKLVIIR